MNNPIDYSLGGLEGSWAGVRYDMTLGQPSGHIDALRMVHAIHSAIEAIERNDPSERNGIIRSLAEAAYAYDREWLTKLDYGHQKPEWMSVEMWDSLRDPAPVR